MRIVEVIGNSMMPKYIHGQLLIIKSVEYKSLKLGDIILININNKQIIKRLVAKGGHIITLNNGKLTINKKVIDEKYLINKRYYDNKKHYWDLAPDEFIVLGDNGIDSLDSRKFGPIKSIDILGRVVMRLWPLF